MTIRYALKGRDGWYAGPTEGCCDVLSVTNDKKKAETFVHRSAAQERLRMLRGFGWTDFSVHCIETRGHGMPDEPAPTGKETEEEGRVHCIVATDADFLSMSDTGIILRFRKKDPGIDLYEAIRRTCREWMESDEGNDGMDMPETGPNWGDLDLNIPDGMFLRHGLEKLETVIIGKEGLVGLDEPVLEHGREA